MKDLNNEKFKMLFRALKNLKKTLEDRFIVKMASTKSHPQFLSNLHQYSYGILHRNRIIAKLL